MSEQTMPLPAPDGEAMKKTRLPPHRIFLIGVAAAILFCMAWFMQWSWIPDYSSRIAHGLGMTLVMLAGTAALGFVFAVLIGLTLVAGPLPLRALAGTFCTVIRGTPLLLQLWLLYYGLGSLFPQFPGIRNSFLWPYLREAWPYGATALTLSFSAYVGEVMRGALAGVPTGELEAGRAFGMGRLTLFRRIWLPRAIQRALPTLNGEVILQLKATPLIATITVVDVYAVIGKVRQDTFLTYEPLLLLAAIYLCLTFLLVSVFRYFERRVPTRKA